MIGRLQGLWQKLTVPHSTGVEDARREYMTRVMLVIAGVPTSIMMPLAIIGWGVGLYPVDVPIAVVLGGLLLGASLWLAQRGHWRFGSYMLPAMEFAIALQINYSQGAGTTALAYYACTLVLAAMLHGVRVQLLTLALCLTSYVGISWAHVQGYLPQVLAPEAEFATSVLDVGFSFMGITLQLIFFVSQFRRAIAQSRAATAELAAHKANLEEQVAARTAELQESYREHEHLHQQVLKAQKQAIRELSTPIIPVMDGIIIMPLIGSIDSNRARDITRTLLAGVSEYRARIVILDITGVPIVDSGIAAHLDKTIQAARLKGAHTILTGIADAVAETIVDLGIDWSGVKTLRDLQTGLRIAMADLKIAL